MAINPYRVLAQFGSLVGDKDIEEAGNAASRGFAKAPRMTVPRGLGSSQTSARRNPNRQQSRTPSPIPPLPDIVLGDIDSRGDNHGYQETRVIPFEYAEFLSEADKKAIERQAQSVPRSAQRMSRGRLSSKRLAKMGHPYGYGDKTPKGRKRRKLPKYLASKKLQSIGVTNMNIVNKQSGRFERSWKMKIKFNKKNIVFTLRASTFYAKYLAKGTPRMKKHGPFGGIAWGAYYKGRTIMNSQGGIEDMVRKRGRQAQLRALALRSPRRAN